MSGLHDPALLTSETLLVPLATIRCQWRRCAVVYLDPDCRSFGDSLGGWVVNKEESGEGITWEGLRRTDQRSL